MARRRPGLTPEEKAAWTRQRRELEELFERRRLRLDAAEARDAAQRARLRRWSLGLLGREPLPPQAP